ncbi:MAG: metallophosphoesterase [Deltaproteobacteria bacterium]|nr:MAG: metallophosphoesterase [Deltaproteobacteria bacterium]
MRIAIFSDIHSNVDALREAITLMKAQNPDRFVCLGDVVGYGADPNGCCELVRPLVEICIMGNHDAAVSGRMNYDYYYDAARNALRHHSELVSETHRKWLANLPYVADDPDDERICYSHGSPINPQDFDYILSTTHADQLRTHWDSLRPVTFIGHSHLTVAYEMPPPDAPESSRELRCDTLQLRDDRKYIITVGSVGQPRDNDARGCFVLLDTDTLTVSYHRVEYDIVSAAERIFADTELAADFGKRLFLGI